MENLLYFEIFLISLELKLEYSVLFTNKYLIFSGNFCHCQITKPQNLKHHYDLSQTQISIHILYRPFSTFFKISSKT